MLFALNKFFIKERIYFDSVTGIESQNNFFDITGSVV